MMSSTTPQQQQHALQQSAPAPGMSVSQSPAFTFGNSSSVRTTPNSNVGTVPSQFMNTKSGALNVNVVNGNFNAQPGPVRDSVQASLAMNLHSANLNFKPMIHPDMQGQMPTQLQQQQLAVPSNGALCPAPAPINMNFNPSAATISTNYNETHMSQNNFNDSAQALQPSLQFSSQLTPAAAPGPGTSAVASNPIGIDQFLQNKRQLEQSPMIMSNGNASSFPLNLSVNAPASMNASLINVTTAAYADPKPSTSKQNIKVRPASAAKKTSPAVRLAVVPTQLASKSIVSLNPSVLSQQPNVRNNLHVNNTVSVQSSQQVLSIQPKPVQQKETGSLPTSEQVEQRRQSSYSSACDATIRAQCALTNDGSSNKPLNDNTWTTKSDEAISTPGNNAVATTPASINRDSSPAKRSSPTSDSEDSRSRHKYVKVFGGKPSVPQKIQSNSNLTLQQYLCNMLKSRGYSDQHYCSLEGGYYCKPTDLQKASYGMKLIQAVRTSDSKLLRKLLNAGLSPNPCNAFGESIIHMVCRRGDVALLKIFLENGCSVQVSDDFGRTPLHDACWTASPCFESVELILNQDKRLLHIVDCRGSAPLSYVKRENWPQWINFFEQRKHLWWPHRDVGAEGEEGPPKLANMAPHSIPLPNPPTAASLIDAGKISSGELDVNTIPEKVVTEARLIDEKDSSSDIKTDQQSKSKTVSIVSLKTEETCRETMGKVEENCEQSISIVAAATATTIKPSSSPVSINISTE